MTDDDRPFGSVLTRREVLALLGAGGLAALGAGRPAGRRRPAGACVVRPGADRGALLRGRAARPLRHPLRSGGRQRCGPARRSAWRCASRGVGAAPARRCPAPWWTCGTATRPASTRTWPIRAAPPSARSSCAATRRPTPTASCASPRSIPGWYRGRAVHIHFKVRTTGGGGRAHEFTSQLFFDDALTDQVLRAAAVRGAGRAAPAQRTRRHLPRGGRPAHPGGRASRRRLRGHVRSRARGGRRAAHYRITRGGSPSTEQLVEAAGYGYAHSCVTSENFPVARDAATGRGGARHRPGRVRSGRCTAVGGARRGGAPRARAAHLRGRALLRRCASGGAAGAPGDLPARSLGRLLRPARRALALE